MGKAPGRVMGIDFGMRHIGVAVSDELRVIARGIETVNWNGEDPEWALNRICEIIKEMEVNAIVLGMPARTENLPRDAALCRSIRTSALLRSLHQDIFTRTTSRPRNRRRS